MRLISHARSSSRLTPPPASGAALAQHDEAAAGRRQLGRARAASPSAAPARRARPSPSTIAATSSLRHRVASRPRAGPPRSRLQAAARARPRPRARRRAARRAALKIATAVWRLRPSERSIHAWITCGAPTSIGPSSATVKRPSTTGALIVPCTGAELGQSSAAHAKSGSTTPSPVHAAGVHGTAKRPSPTGPVNRHSASAGSRSGPQPKQVGNGWSCSQAKRSAAAAASSSPTGSGPSSDSSAGRAWRRRPRRPPARSPPSPRTTASGVSSGGGRRSVTSRGGRVDAACRRSRPSSRRGPSRAAR